MQIQYVSVQWLFSEEIKGGDVLKNNLFPKIILN